MLFTFGSCAKTELNKNLFRTGDCDADRDDGKVTDDDDDEDEEEQERD